MSETAENCTHNCGTCSANCGSRTSEPQSFLEKLNPASSVKKVIGVVSGKGGVGKSLVTSLMACRMRATGARVGILDAELQGSIGYDSPEGRDKCHEAELFPAHEKRPETPHEEVKSGLKLDFSPNAMVQAMVMQEVLTRPCEGRKR